MTYVWVIPAVAPSYNVHIRMHWSKQERARCAFIDAAWPLLYERGNACPRPLKTPVVMHAVVSRTTVRRRDSDNASMPLYKWINDLLVCRGFLPDDTHDLVTNMPPRLVVGEREETVVLIEEAMGL